ncbi:MAG TPA: NUDIX domain-containing protein [Acidimicrobiales bacterium]|nr:NUDIX domain-containing protein [Acidimicrobiales bacterium]
MTEALSNEPNPAFTGVISAVVALVCDENGRVLLASSSESGPWSCIGGGVVEGQDLASAAIKFAREDCGLTVEVGDVVAELSGDQYRVLYECGADTTYRATVYDAKLLAEDEPAPLRANWFTPAQLAGLCLDEFATAALSDLHLL